MSQLSKLNLHPPSTAGALDLSARASKARLIYLQILKPEKLSWISELHFVDNTTQPAKAIFKTWLPTKSTRSSRISSEDKTNLQISYEAAYVQPRVITLLDPISKTHPNYLFCNWLYAGQSKWH